jgi:hypothetical protein
LLQATPSSATATPKRPPARSALLRPVEPGSASRDCASATRNRSHGGRLLRELLRVVRGCQNRLAPRDGLELSGNGGRRGSPAGHRGALRLPAALPYDDEIEIRTQATLLSPIRIRFDYEVLRDGTVLTTGHTVHAALTSKAGPVACRAVSSSCCDESPSQSFDV